MDINKQEQREKERRRLVSVAIAAAGETAKETAVASMRPEED